MFAPLSLRIRFIPRAERGAEGEHGLCVRLWADRGQPALCLLSAWKPHRPLHGQPTQVWNLEEFLILLQTYFILVLLLTLLCTHVHQSLFCFQLILCFWCNSYLMFLVPVVHLSPLRRWSLQTRLLLRLVSVNSKVKLTLRHRISCCKTKNKNIKPAQDSME